MGCPERHPRFSCWGAGVEEQRPCIQAPGSGAGLTPGALRASQGQLRGLYGSGETGPGGRCGGAQHSGLSTGFPEGTGRLHSQPLLGEVEAEARQGGMRWEGGALPRPGPYKHLTQSLCLFCPLLLRPRKPPDTSPAWEEPPGRAGQPTAVCGVGRG